MRNDYALPSSLTKGREIDVRVGELLVQERMRGGVFRMRDYNRDGSRKVGGYRPDYAPIDGGGSGDYSGAGGSSLGKENHSLIGAPKRSVAIAAAA